MSCTHTPGERHAWCIRGHGCLGRACTHTIVLPLEPGGAAAVLCCSSMHHDCPLAAELHSMQKMRTDADDATPHHLMVGAWLELSPVLERIARALSSQPPGTVRLGTQAPPTIICMLVSFMVHVYDSITIASLIHYLRTYGY